VIRRTLKYYRQLNTEVPGLRAVIVTRPEQLAAAKELHARIYRALDFVTDADLTRDGLRIGPDKDPYQAHAQYFSVEGVRDGGLRTVATEVISAKFM
jgi:hypothetical protein